LDTKRQACVTAAGRGEAALLGVDLTNVKRSSRIPYPDSNTLADRGPNFTERRRVQAAHPDVDAGEDAIAWSAAP
jgi:hypothetical protein